MSGDGKTFTVLCVLRASSPHDLLQSMRTFIFNPSLRGGGTDRPERSHSLLPVTFSPHTHTLCLSVQTVLRLCTTCVSVFTVLTCLFGQWKFREVK